MKHWILAFIWLLAVACVAQDESTIEKKESWRDPSPHQIQFVTVEKGIRLEVLDWGGSGRPLVLLAGLGMTPHVFDDFAPKLVPQYHIYGITRRGCGASSIPEDGYSADRLGDDVLAVLDALKIERPVLVGHSIAGQELSSVATRHAERIAGLIYLEAGYSYAYYDSSKGDFEIDMAELHRKLERFQKLPGDDVPKWKEMVHDLLHNELPLFEKGLKAMQKRLKNMPKAPPEPAAGDLASFPAYGSWFARLWGVSVPESELRQIFETRADGGPGKEWIPKNVAESISGAIIAGGQRYTNIKVPVLAIYAVPLATSAAHTFEAGVPSARVIRLQNANHFVFISNEADVLREMRAFLIGLP